MSSAPAVRRLVITADDFGMADPVNEAIEIAASQGVLTAASLMVGAPAAADAVRRAGRLPYLHVGLHLVLTDGRPVLAPERIPHLVGEDGRFHDNMALAGVAMFLHPAARAELAAEITAQFQAFAATGLTLDHVNAHKHFHLHPTICGLALAIGRRFGARAMRAPCDPDRRVSLSEPFARLVKMRAARAGLLTPDRVFGLAWSGAMSTERLENLIRTLPSGLSEIYLHPATTGDFAGAAAGYRYGDELTALTSPSVAAAVGARGVELGGFGDFAAMGSR
jgi:hopanoid biosynthesis associated protein HpnK